MFRSSQSSSQLFGSFRIVILLVLLGQACRGGLQRRQGEPSEYPDGYFPFEESPSRTPPKVRRPPYAQADVECPGLEATGANTVQSLDNLCGDLNKGYIPKSPLGRNVNGHSYPFELIRNKTLDFFSSTLPILKADKNLPKLAKYEDFDVVDRSDERRKKTKRSSPDESNVESEEENGDHPRRQGRGLCDKNYGIICTIMSLINGRFLSAINPQERIEDPDLLQNNNFNLNKNGNQIGEDPLTPCPSAAEYVTPVYAKNYQGVWRYVVQIPYEGYFTQTVEVTKCLKKKCHFMDGSCLASPRWVSLLVAELFYPHARFPATKPGTDPIGTSYRSMTKSKNGGHKELIPPQVFPELPPYIPRNFPFVQKEVQGEGDVTADERSDVESKEGQEEEMNDEEQETEDSTREKRQAAASSSPTDSANKQTYCDGVDEIGCFQVRLYYDWLLVPGSCKCWKQDFFTKYGRKA